MSFTLHFLSGLPGTVAIVEKFLASFGDLPARQRPVSFIIDQALEKMQRASEKAQPK